jgi:putative tryptophan/tyrosine transport system substrate-binding protein
VNRRHFLLISVAGVFAAPLAVQGQQAGPSKVGLLLLSTAGTDWAERSGIEVREGLHELGWVENQNIHFQYRFAGGRHDRLGQLADELVKDKVDVIVTMGTEATRAARRATSSIPIVMGGAGDPVRAGFIASLSRPGGDARGRHLHPRSTARRIAEAASGRGTTLRTGASERAGHRARRSRLSLH